MAEIGAGNGSDYPGALDSNASLEYNNSVSSRTKARAEVPNDLAAAIVAIETELGVDPAGTRSTVVSYLQQEHTTTGAHNDAYVVNVSGTQTVTGQKTFTGGVNVGVSGIWGNATVGASGFVRASGDGTLFPRTVALGEKVSSGIVPWARIRRDDQRIANAGAITVTSVLTNIITMGHIPVSASDIVMVHGRCSLTKGGTDGQTKLLISNNGTAVIRFGPVRTTLEDTISIIAGTERTVTLMGIGLVETGGTAQWLMTGDSDGSDSTVGSGQADLGIYTLHGE